MTWADVATQSTFAGDLAMVLTPWSVAGANALRKWTPEVVGFIKAWREFMQAQRAWDVQAGIRLERIEANTELLAQSHRRLLVRLEELRNGE